MIMGAITGALWPGGPSRTGGHMNTQLIKLAQNITYQEALAHPAVVRAAGLLRDGQIVAFPTETVYGLGANAFNEGAVAAVFAAKGRPADNPLIVHISRMAQLDEVACSNELALTLAQAFWPGPLTLVLHRKDTIGDIVTAGLSTVGVRMPSHPVARALIELAEVPVAAPSANTSTRPSPTTGEHVYTDLKGKIPLILDAGPVDIGLESTVLGLCRSQATILRPGFITAEDLQPYCKEVAYAGPVKSGAPVAPGMKYPHYSPQGRVILALGQDIVKFWRESQSIEEKILLIVTQETAQMLPQEAQPDVFIIAARDDLPAFARNLFAAFRLADARGAKTVIVETVPEEGLGIAIMNRLRKAAGLL